MNIAYYQNLLVKEFSSVINSSSDVEINISSETIKTQTITKQKAVKDLFEIGLDMDLFLNTEDYNRDKITPIIEYAASNTDEFGILKICLEHLSKDFFCSLDYSKQCDILGEIVSKNISKDMTSENKNILLEQLFDKGFSFKQTDSNSKELDWIDYGYTDFVDVTIKKQPSFNWNHVYNSAYSTDESITILEKIIIAIEDTNVGTESKFKTSKLANLHHMKEQVEKITMFQSLEGQLEDKATNSTKMKI
jgi:hypothetical protein